MATASARTIGIAAGALGLVGVLYFLIPDGGDARSSPPAAGDEEHSGAAGASPGTKPTGGVKSRAVDPANYIAAEFTTDPNRRSELMLEADRAKDLLEAVRAGETHWEPTLIDMDFSDQALETYLECSSSYLRQPCPYTIDYVIEVKEPGIAEVVFGRVVLEKTRAQDCEQYAKCMVEGNVGAKVVVAPEVSGIVSHRKSQTDNYADVTLEELQEMLEIMQKGVAAMEERGPDGQADWEYRLELERSYILLLKMRIAALGE